MKDAHESELIKSADFFCNKYASKAVTDSSISIVQSVISGTETSGRTTIDIARDYTGTDSLNDVYDFTIKWVDKCTPNGGFNLPEPVAGHKCSDVLYHAWKDCKLYSILLPYWQLSSLGSSHMLMRYCSL